MDRIELIDGTTIECLSLEKDQFNALLKRRHSLLQRYKNHYSIDVYLFDNGELAVNEDGYYTLYFALNDLDKVLNQPQNSQTELLLNKNPFKEKFPGNAKLLVKKLKDELDAPEKENEQDLLLFLDNKIDSLKDAREFRKNNFISLLAVLGDALIQKYSANWEMELGRDGVTWNPYISVKGRKVEFFVYLYEDVFLKGNNRVLSELYLTMCTIIENNL